MDWKYRDAVLWKWHSDFLLSYLCRRRALWGQTWRQRWWGTPGLWHWHRGAWRARKMTKKAWKMKKKKFKIQISLIWIHIMHLLADRLKVLRISQHFQISRRFETWFSKKVFSSQNYIVIASKYCTFHIIFRLTKKTIAINKV